MSVLVGKKAPLFYADAVINGSQFVEKFSLEQYIGKKYVVFFFYPMDFTFVCPTEILAFQEKLKEFEDRNCAVIGCSVDSKFSHWAWLNTPKEKGGIQGVTFPLVSDFSKTISENYDVLAGYYDYDVEDEVSTFIGEPVAYRGLFLIDKQGIVRHQIVNDTPLGRNVDEAIRMVDALQFYEEHGEVCPANWHKGEEGIKATKEGIAEYLSKH
ncbi:MAG TPA: peroxiredoxin [Bacteroidales bacterium]|jgi:peroxiredoxin (alkyl hydroperoxide reductase subunit C)|nr:peroxiredoxin [Bacteroidales bacterium]MDI9572884.1 peroxiredoxin [Bacteroidota bacterium]OQC60880.1 MAG: putative peroxiredoxin [Bacteroidetes bacterium ADurb.Bin012]MBP9510858.1 peroxiredoxin [Bacteroidales bacterium]MBP9587810.1 peroxiredoxin [Bacteroidales bacterium]